MAGKKYIRNTGDPETAYYRCIYPLFLIGGIDFLFASLAHEKLNQEIFYILMGDGILTIVLFTVSVIRPRMWPLYLAALTLVADVVWVHIATEHVQHNPLGSQAFRLFFLVIILMAGSELKKWKHMSQ